MRTMSVGIPANGLTISVCCILIIHANGLTVVVVFSLLLQMD